MFAPVPVKRHRRFCVTDARAARSPMGMCHRLNPAKGTDDVAAGSGPIGIATSGPECTDTNRLVVLNWFYPPAVATTRSLGLRIARSRE